MSKTHTHPTIEELADEENNPVRVRQLLKAEADAGSPDACESLGLMYFNGAGVPRDMAKAVMYESRAAVPLGSFRLSSSCEAAPRRR